MSALLRSVECCMFGVPAWGPRLERMQTTFTGRVQQWRSCWPPVLNRPCIDACHERMVYVHNTCTVSKAAAVVLVTKRANIHSMIGVPAWSPRLQGMQAAFKGAVQQLVPAQYDAGVHCCCCRC
jgi:hypothetical protein